MIWNVRLAVVGLIDADSAEEAVNKMRGELGDRFDLYESDAFLSEDQGDPTNDPEPGWFGRSPSDW